MATVQMNCSSLPPRHPRMKSTAFNNIQGMVIQFVFTYNHQILRSFVDKDVVCRRV